ncbi:unnamed protein product [Adineta steineri]|uniref:G-protein coupled receptors family 1 profile domain-containing protein n=2 Tax=Adineta steineri TaxID=433720 RepID=A0A819X1E4_9BILA|nr:unnamed protein product [Adineta steineri]
MSSNNASIADEINNLNLSMQLLYQITSIIFIVIGAVGHTLSIYVFTRPEFLPNPCARYFLASAISGSIVVYTIVPIRMLQFGYNINLLIYSTSVCQVLSYFLVCARLLPSWFIALASIDRFLASSPSTNLRAWSNIHIATRVILITVLFICLINIHYPLNQTIVLLPKISCTFSSGTYQAFFSLWNLTIWSWIPTILMLISGLLTIRHIHQSKKRITPQNNSQQNQKKLDRHLIRMLIIQCFIFGFTTTVCSVIQLYVSITNSLIVKSDLTKAKEQYAMNAANLIAIAGPCTSFYLFTLSSQLFRRQLVNAFCGQRFSQNLTTTNGVTNPRDGQHVNKN